MTRPAVIAAFLVAVFPLIAAWLLGWTLLLTRARRLVESPRARTNWNHASALTLIALGVRTAVV